jgi:hypothetical protein
MKRIVDGVAYNTWTSTKLAMWGPQSNTDSLGRDCEVSGTLYQTPKGAFFAHYETITQIPGTDDRDAYDREENEFEPLTPDKAREWLVKGKNIEIIDETFAKGIPEAEAAEAESGATVYVRVPAALKQRIDEAARDAGQSASVWGLKCFERCLAA